MQHEKGETLSASSDGSEAGSIKQTADSQEEKNNGGRSSISKNKRTLKERVMKLFRYKQSTKRDLPSTSPSHRGSESRPPVPPFKPGSNQIFNDDDDDDDDSVYQSYRPDCVVTARRHQTTPSALYYASSFSPSLPPNPSFNMWHAEGSDKSTGDSLPTGKSWLYTGPERSIRPDQISQMFMSDNQITKGNISRLDVEEQTATGLPLDGSSRFSRAGDDKTRPKPRDPPLSYPWLKRDKPVRVDQPIPQGLHPQFRKNFRQKGFIEYPPPPPPPSSIVRNRPSLLTPQSHRDYLLSYSETLEKSTKPAPKQTLKPHRGLLRSPSPSDYTLHSDQSLIPVPKSLHAGQEADLISGGSNSEDTVERGFISGTKLRDNIPTIRQGSSGLTVPHFSGPQSQISDLQDSRVTKGRKSSDISELQYEGVLVNMDAVNTTVEQSIDKRTTRFSRWLRRNRRRDRSPPSKTEGKIQPHQLFVHRPLLISEASDTADKLSLCVDRGETYRVSLCHNKTHKDDFSTSSSLSARNPNFSSSTHPIVPGLDRGQHPDSKTRVGYRSIVTNSQSRLPKASQSKLTNHRRTPEEMLMAIRTGHSLTVYSDHQQTFIPRRVTEESGYHSDAVVELEAAVTAVNCSVTNTQPIQTCSSGSSWTEGVSGSLPRSHSCPSLSHMTSAGNKTLTRAQSSPDLQFNSSCEQFTPDITADEEDETYRFQCSSPGLYQCSMTGLVFHMEGEGDVVYRTVPWNRKLLSQHHKQPAGPLFDIKCEQQSVCQLHLPHCEICSTGGADFLSVAHLDEEGIEFIHPHKITETHVVINITGFSAFGNVKDEDSPPDPVRALVLVFYKPPADPDPTSLFNVMLLPRNVAFRGVLCYRKKLDGDERYIETSPHCKLHPQQEYTLSTCPQDDSVLVEPTTAEFDSDNYDNYFPSFQVTLEKNMTHLKLFLRDTNNSSLSVWERRVCLSSSGVQKSCGQSSLNLSPDKRLFEIRSSFIEGVSGPVLKSLLDKLLEKTVMTDSEQESVDEMRNRGDKARLVIDTVRRKGEAASSEMIDALCDLDPFFSEHLGLM